VKIDRSFVDGLGTDGEDSAIVGGLGRFQGRAICLIGHEKGDDGEAGQDALIFTRAVRQNADLVDEPVVLKLSAMLTIHASGTCLSLESR